MKKILAGVRFVLLVLLLPAFAHAAPLDTGINWLTTNQNSDLSWGNTPTSLALPFQATASALSSLKTAKQTATPQYLGGIQWFSTYQPSTVEEIADTIVTRALSGGNVIQELTTLMAMRTPEGAWGSDADYQADVIPMGLRPQGLRDTANALTALAAAGAPEADHAATFAYLLSAQNAANSHSPDFSIFLSNIA